MTQWKGWLARHTFEHLQRPQWEFQRKQRREPGLAPQPVIVRLPNPGQRSLRLRLGFMQGKLWPQFLDPHGRPLATESAHLPSGPSAFQFDWPFDRQARLPINLDVFRDGGPTDAVVALRHSSRPEQNVNFSAGSPSVGAAIWNRWEAEGEPGPGGRRGIKAYFKNH
jgi:hypothetical protein